MIRKIVDAKDKSLRKTAKPVKKIDKKIISLTKDLEDTLKIQKDPEGVGLAAPQIGKPLRVFSMVDDGKIKTIINPKILKIEKTKIKKKGVLEGCLSIPYYYGPITRAGRVLLKYLDKEGNSREEIFKGFPAQIVQHEVDHLEGKLFIDIILAKKLPLYYIKGDEWEEVDLI